MAVIEANDLSWAYENRVQRVPILKNVSFRIDEGEFVAIQGPSGSGKSTLLYLLGCLMRPQSGSLKLAGKNIAQMSDDTLSHFRNEEIGFVFQQFHLLPKASLLKNILLPTYYGKSENSEKELAARAAQLATELGLGARLDHLPNQLSGGQQQRVAIARALINQPSLILADEPTGNLDSQSSAQIMALFREFNRQGKTIVIITHDDHIAQKCDRIIRIKDGQVQGDAPTRVATESTPVSAKRPAPGKRKILRDYWKSLRGLGQYIPLALENLSRNKARTVLTMLGISVGIAAVLSMITLGQFTKEKILAGYAEMGVNTMVFMGYPNWDLRATDKVPVSFRSFDWHKDIAPLRKVFPEIQRISPVMNNWNGSVSFGGRLIQEDIRLHGVNEEAFLISPRRFLMGRNFTRGDVERKASLCIIGYDIARRLFTNVSPLGQVMTVINGEITYGCTVIGVLEQTTSNKEWLKPNSQVFFPYTFFQATSGSWWSSQIYDLMIQTEPKADVEKIGRGLKAYFEQKYGRSGEFRANSDSVLIAQMKRFLSLFTILLALIAFVTLAVGGIGITNMMLVGVSERFREIGLRKAVGATGNTIRSQFLAESLTVCALAGLVGLVAGVSMYHLAIFGATKFVSKLNFEWTFDAGALTLSLLSILLVGILSGLFPAWKAEKLQVIEALRSE